MKGIIKGVINIGLVLVSVLGLSLATGAVAQESVNVPNDITNINFSLGTVSSPFGYSIILLNNSLAGPAELDFDTQGNIYVANEGEADVFLFEDFISKLAPDGETIALTYIDGLEGSSGIAVDEEGNIYVSQNVDLPLRKYNSDGELVFEFESHRPEFTDPNTLALTDDGRLLAGVANALNTSKWKILAFDIQTGNRLADFTPEFDSNFVNSIVFKDGQLFIGHQSVDGTALGPLLLAQEGSMPVSLPFNFPVNNLDGLDIGNAGVIYATSGEELFKIEPDGSVDILIEGFTFARGVQAVDDYLLVVDFQEGYNGALYRIDLELVGTISGTVIDSTTSQPIPNIQVRAESLPRPPTSIVVATTDSGGNYTLVVPPGTYNVRTCGICSGLNYVDEYYDGQYFFGLATPVEVTPSSNISNINFSVEPGAVISGNVVDEATSDPIPNILINAYNYTTSEFIASTTTNASGDYAMVVPTGSYRIDALTVFTGTNYVDEYYDDHYARTDADPVEVPTLDPVPNINFGLEIGGTVTGTVIDSATSQPINSIHVSASDYESDKFFTSRFTDPNGNYTLRLPAGTYRIRTNAFITGLNYTDEYYDDTYIFEEATPVSVTVPDNTPNINFSLEGIMNQVSITAGTNYDYRPVGDSVPGTTATASPWIYSNLFNWDDDSNSAVTNPILNLNSTKPISFVTPQDSLIPGSAYTWTPPDIAENGMFIPGASVIEPMTFTTGLSVTRSIDQTFFPPEGGTQTLSLTVIPEEVMGRLDIHGNANFGVFQGVATITSVSGDGIFADPGGQW